MKIKYTIPLEINPETPYGIVDISNLIIKNGMLMPMTNVFKIKQSEFFHKLFVRKRNGFYYTNESDKLWAFPVNIITATGRTISYPNVNMMKVNVYNDIIRIINLSIFNSEDNSYYNVLYIDPPYGFYDNEIFDNTEYSYLSASDLVNNCIDNIFISPEGQILSITSEKNTKIYGFYQLNDHIVVFSNKGIYQLNMINGTHYFEIQPVKYIDSYDVIDIRRTYATENEIFFVYNDELYILYKDGYESSIRHKRVSCSNLIKGITKDNDFYVFCVSGQCSISSNRYTKSLFYDISHGLTGICDFSISGIDTDLFIIKNYGSSDYLLKLENELNDTRLKIIREIIVYGCNMPNYLTVDILSDINPNYVKYKSYNFNSQGIAHCNHVCSSLNFILRGSLPDIRENTVVNGIDIIFEYVDRKVKYEREYVARSRET